MMWLFLILLLFAGCVGMAPEQNQTLTFNNSTAEEGCDNPVENVSEDVGVCGLE